MQDNSLNASEPEVGARTDAAAAALYDTLELAIRHLDRGEPALALPLLEQAVSSAPEFPFAVRLLGDAKRELGDFEAAETEYKLAMMLDPNVSGVDLGLGQVMLATGRLDEAAQHLAKAVAANPDLWPSLHELGSALLDAGRPADAMLAFHAIREVAPDADGVALLAIGVCLRAMGRDDDAIAAYRAAAEAQPALAEAHENLATALYASGRADEAGQAVRNWLAALPNDPVAAHLAGALGAANKPPAASAAYIRATFDRQAAHFDQALASVDYSVPNLIAAKVAGILNPKPAGLDVVDIGCGTGLSGAVLRPWARTLVGVDLSPSMLEIAQARGIYDRLELTEAQAFLQAHPATYHLITAADVLIYAGDLAGWVQSLAGALRVGGAVAASVETHEGPEPWRLLASGRYSHAVPPLVATFEAAGLTVKSVEPAVLRKERGTAVEGTVLIAVKGR
ncbi:MAG TPA: tetratricopeptide repeat protein [Azospirillaceae bacterium]|nr:tetratricopeptide repeat protein [Azospirillaceae bacterium]